MYLLHIKNRYYMIEIIFHEPFIQVQIGRGFPCPKCVVNLVYDADFSSKILFFTVGQQASFHLKVSTLIRRIKTFMFMNIFMFH